MTFLRRLSKDRIEDPFLPWCTIWDDVRTYLTSRIDPKEKAALLVAIAHFKKEVEQ